MKNIFLFLFSLCILVTADAQDLTMYSLDSVWQQNNVNPALFTPEKGHVSVSNFGLGVNSSLSFNDIFTKSNDKYTIKVSDVLENLEERNQFGINSSFETVSFGRKFGEKLFLSFGHAAHQNIEIDFPSDLVDIAANGNGEYINETADLGIGFDVHSYNEYKLGLQYKIGKVTLGGNLKILSGNASVYTKKREFGLHTDDDIYQLTATTDYDIELGALIPLNDIEDFELKFDVLDFKSAFDNIGLGFDFGAQFEATDKLSFSASVIDIGKVRYKEGLSLTSTGTYTYDGVDVNNIFSDSVSINVTFDTIVNAFNFDKTNKEVSRPLNTRYFAGVSYKLNKMINLGLVGKFRTDNQDVLLSSFAVNADFHIKKYLRLGTSYVIEDDNFTNLGLRMSLQFGNFQVYAITNNILNAFDIKDADHVTLQMGANYIY